MTTLIRKHDFNSDWLNENIGIITDIDFFSQPKKEIVAALNQFAWVELRTDKIAPQQLYQLHSLNFWQVDEQIAFDLALRKIAFYPEIDNLELISAKDKFFSVGPHDIHSFKNERFLALPNISEEDNNKRFIIWANQLIEQYPEWCLQINQNGKTQGWYLGVPSEEGIELTLTMLHKDAVIRGKFIYHKAIQYYAKNFANGFARFSAKNLAVLNILSSLGAKFKRNENVWFWVNENYFG